ncbi:MAG: hypothetical protein UHO61_09120 [Acutalibacteraceae bacterium]|nr:hypothetical protein [Acutalibacteraceae bacterium]
MIALAPISDKDEIKRLFSESGLEYTEISGCVKAKCGKEVLGFCLYDMDKSGIVIYKIAPENDLSLADGILRSTLHVAAERSIMNAFYSGDETGKLCDKLNFIINKEEKRLNINRLFESCCSCKKAD